MSSERTWTSFRFARLGLLVLGVLMAFATVAHAADDPPLTQYQVEAAFLYHFAKYVTWPAQAFASPDDPIVIGVLGEDPFGDDLTNNVARQKPVQGRPLRVVHGHTPAELARCHILFIGKSEKTRLAQHLEALREADSHALTVGECEAFLPSGGVVRFVVQENKVRFDINLDAAGQADLTISSKLLSLARNTTREKP